MDMTLKQAVTLVLEMARDCADTGVEEQAIDQVGEFFKDYFRNYPDHD